MDFGKNAVTEAFFARFNETCHLAFRPFVGDADSYSIIPVHDEANYSPIVDSRADR